MSKHRLIGVRRIWASIVEALQNRNISIIVVTWALFGTVFPIFGQFSSDYTRKLGATPEIIGLMGSAVTIINLLVRIPGGFIADRRGRRKLMAWGTFLATFPSLVRAIAGSWESYFIALIVSNVITGTYGPALRAIYEDSLPAESRGFADSLINGICWAIPGIAGSLIGGYVYERHGTVGLRVALLAQAITYALAGLLRSGCEETVMTPVTEGLDLSGAVSALKDSFLSLPELFAWAKGTAGHLLILDMLFGITDGISGAFWVLYALDTIGLTKFGWGVMNSIFSLLYFPLRMIGGRIADRKGRVRQMRFAPVLWIVGNLVFVSARRLEVALVAWLIRLYGDMFWWPAWSALWIDVIPRSRRGRMASARGIVRGISATIASGIGGYLYAFKGASPFYAVVAIQVVVLVMGLLLEEPMKREE